jgi:putative Holliday junction resolvase
MKIMSVDYGDARTGIAACDREERLASPVCVIAEKAFTKTAEKTAAKARELGAELIVVGCPRNMNGTSGPRAEKSQMFADKLRALTDVPVELWDERCTTMSAAVYLNITDTRGAKRRGVIDAEAASIILEDYLSYRKNTGARG